MSLSKVLPFNELKKKFGDNSSNLHVTNATSIAELTNRFRQAYVTDISLQMSATRFQMFF
jgi:hypothetical protein